MPNQDIEVLVTEFRADIRRYEAALRRQVNATERTAKANERRWAQMNRRILQNQERTEQRLRRLVSGAAIALAGRELLGYERQWRSLNNTLKQYEDVLGPAITSTTTLNKVANEAGVPVGELGPLIGAASRAARTLGDRGGDDVIAFGEAFSKAAALANTGQSAVAGATTQLSQAIGSPTVQLQEFQSVIEGTPRLAQAFADGIDEAGGSVAKLRKLIASGDISGRDLFEALLSQLPRIREEFRTLNQGPEQSLTRLRNRLAEFVGTNAQLVTSSQGLARAIDFLAEDVDAFADVIVVAGAALVGYFGARAAARIVAGIAAQAAGFRALHAQIATVAFFSGRAAAGMTALRAATAFVGGPVVAGVTILAGAMALLGTNTAEARATFDNFEGTLNRYQQTLREISADEDRAENLRELLKTNKDITDAIREQGFASRETLVAEIAALDQRIAKNKELQRVYELSLRTQATSLEAQVDRQRTEVSTVRDLLRDAERRFQSQFREGREGPRLVNPLGPDGQAASRAALSPTDAQVADAIARRFTEIEEKKAAGLSLTRKERKDLEAIVKLREDEARLASTRATIDQLNAGTVTVTPPGLGGGGGGTEDEEEVDEDAVRKTKQLLKEIERAFNSAFESEIEGIRRVRDERLAAVEEAVLTEEEKAAERVRINQTSEEEIRQVRERQAQEELDLLAQVFDERDRATGRIIALAEREFESKKNYIEKNITDEERRTEALLALEQTRVAAISELEEQLHQERLDRALEEARTIEEGFRAQFAVMVEEAGRANAEVGKLFARTFGPGGRVSAAIASSAADALVFGESFTESIKGAARAIISDLLGALIQLGIEFAVQQTIGAALGQAAVATSAAQAASTAAAWAPAAALASLATLGANAAPASAAVAGTVALTQGLALASSVGGFREGGLVGGRGSGRSDSNLVRVSRGEFINNAPSTARNLPLLEALNRGEALEDILPKFQAGGVVGRSLASGMFARPSVNVQSPAAPNVTVNNQEGETRIINAGNFDEAMSAYLNSPEGAKVVVNLIGRKAGAIRGALGGGSGVGG